jgi:hypothetical protein
MGYIRLSGLGAQMPVRANIPRFRPTLRPRFTACPGGGGVGPDGRCGSVPMRRVSLGDVATVLNNGSVVYGQTLPTTQGWSRGRWNANNPNSAAYGPNGGMNLAQLQALYQTNPSALTPAQLAQLQTAGTVANTLPYSDLTQLPASGATVVSTVAPATTATASALSLTDPTTWPWYMWAAIAVGAYFIFSGGKGRR